jgi:hypothetical protein
MKTYTRKPKETKPVVAICYDFDKTLSPDDMQAQGFIRAEGLIPRPLGRMKGIKSRLQYH